MARKQAFLMVALALTTILATGAGLGLLLLGNGDRSSPADGGSTAGAANAVPEPAAASSEFTLVNTAAAIARPDAPSRIVIPAIMLDAKVTEVGITVENGKPVWETAAFAVGYHRGTALPGTRGNTVMAGHISSPVSKKGDIFRRLPEVRINDRVEIHAGDRRVTYEITEMRLVSPTAVQVMNQTDEATLTLITCYPDNNYSKRLVVTGKLVQPS